MMVITAYTDTHTNTHTIQYTIYTYDVESSTFFFGKHILLYRAEEKTYNKWKLLEHFNFIQKSHF